VSSYPCTTVNRYEKPDEQGHNGPIRSTCMCENRRTGTGNILGLKRHAAVLFSHCNHLRVKAETKDPHFRQTETRTHQPCGGSPNTRMVDVLMKKHQQKRHPERLQLPACVKLPEGEEEESLPRTYRECKLRKGQLLEIDGLRFGGSVRFGGLPRFFRSTGAERTEPVALRGHLQQWGGGGTRRRRPRLRNLRYG
jgi:hypothetical protein